MPCRRNPCNRKYRRWRPLEHVVAAEPDQMIVADIALDEVVFAVAGPGKITGAGILQIFKVREQRQVRQRGHNGVVAFIGELHQRIAGIRDDIGIVSL